MIDLCLIALPNPGLSNPKMYFPLGILYLAAVVRKKYSVKIVDMRLRVVLIVIGIVLYVVEMSRKWITSNICN